MSLSKKVEGISIKDKMRENQLRICGHGIVVKREARNKYRSK